MLHHSGRSSLGQHTFFIAGLFWLLFIRAAVTGTEGLTSTCTAAVCCDCVDASTMQALEKH